MGALKDLNLNIVEMTDENATLDGGDVLFTGRLHLSPQSPHLLCSSNVLQTNIFVFGFVFQFFFSRGDYQGIVGFNFSNARVICNG